MAKSTQNLGIIGAANRAFADAFAANSKDKSYALVLSKKASTIQRTEVGSPTEEFDAADGIVGAMLPEHAIMNVTNRTTHQRGAIYQAWDNTKNMVGKSFYVDYNAKPEGGAHGVYLCLDNNNGALSVSPPKGTSPNPITTSDGYVWQYIYSITGTMQMFLTNKWLPVPRHLTTKDVDDRMMSVAGGIIRFHVDSLMRNVRFTSQPKIILKQKPTNEATFEIITDYFSNLSVSVENGYQIKKLRVINRGSGYTQSFNNMFLMSEPSYPENYSADIIVGNGSLPDGTQGPLIYPVLYPKIFDRISILNAHRVMIAMNIASDDLRKQTNVNTFDSVALIENLYVKDENGKSVPIQNKYEQKLSIPTFIRMSDKITISGTSTTNLIIDNNLESAATQGFSIRSTGDVVSKTVGTDTVLEIARSSRDWNTGEVIYNSSVETPTKVITSRATVSMSEVPKAQQDTKSYVGNVTTNTINKVEKGIGELGETSKVLYTTTMPSSNPTTSYQGLIIRILIGD